jgi:rhodanese-related sulfurtransferase
MIKFLRNLLNAGSAVNLEELLQHGAIIVDVRTEREFKAGHAKGSINIPLDKLTHHLSKLKKDKPVITCCASGMRSATAKNILKRNGFSEVYNAGSWTSIKK